MTKRILWDKYEAALLLDGYIQITQGADRESVIAKISNMLRALGKKRGIEVDDKYRNINGITLQMSSLEFAFTDGKSGINHPIKLFYYISELYHNDQNQFNKILEMAEKMVNTNLEKENYVLAENVRNVFRSILKEQFSDGLKLDSISFEKIRHCYYDKTGNQLSYDNITIMEELKNIGVLLEDKIYPPLSDAQKNILNMIINNVKETLDNGATCIYLTQILDKWQSEFNELLHVFNVNALKSLLQNFYNKLFVINRDTLQISRSKLETKNDVLNVLKDNYTPVTYKELQKKLWYLPFYVIKNSLISEKSIVHVSPESYFYAPNFPATDSELEEIKKYILNELSYKHYVLAIDLADALKTKFPDLVDDTKSFKNYGYMNVFSYLFRNEFSCSQGIIAPKGKTMSITEVYRQFCQDHSDGLTLDEIKDFSNEIDIPIYWDIIFEEMVRINPTTMVPRSSINFNVPETDSILQQVCTEDYIPLQAVDGYSFFPTIPYKWNIYILESYLLQSQQFQLLHVSYAQNRVFGIMARKFSSFHSYQDVIIDILAHNDEWSNNQEAFNLLIKCGCQARRSLISFDLIIKKAKLLREKIDKE